MAIYAKSYIAVARVRTAHDKGLGYFDLVMLNNDQTGADKCTLTPLQATMEIYVVFPVYRLRCRLLKGSRMVARALWRSEARRVVPWPETLHEP